MLYETFQRTFPTNEKTAFFFKRMNVIEQGKLGQIFTAVFH